MNTTWLKTTLASVTVCGLLIGTAALAGPGKTERDGKPGAKRLENRPFLQALFGNLERLAEFKEELNLTPEQNDQIKTILQNHKPEIAAKLRALQERGQQIQAAVTADTVDETAIRAAIQELTQPLAEAAVVKARIHQEVMAVLTDEQRQKAKQAREDLKANKEEALKQFEAQ